MPIGVPKIVFQIPGEEEANWVDLYNALYRSRALFLFQEVETEIANQIMGLMVFLTIEDPNKEQFLFINSPGGSVSPGIGIYDAMQWLNPDFNTIALGLAASMGSYILVGGEMTKRVAYPHARVMIHQPTSTFEKSKTWELLMDANTLFWLRERITLNYVQRTKQPYWVIYEDMERDSFMSATEAQAYGIVDHVGLDFLTKPTDVGNAEDVKDAESKEDRSRRNPW